jgi:hypothetical protein
MYWPQVSLSYGPPRPDTGIALPSLLFHIRLRPHVPMHVCTSMHVFIIPTAQMLLSTFNIPYFFRGYSSEQAYMF